MEPAVGRLRSLLRTLRPVGAWLVAGAVLREGLAAWTGHPYDLEVWIRTGHAVAAGQNPYLMFWPAVPGVSFAYLGETLPSAAYLPFWPAIFGGTYGFWSGVGGGDRFLLYFLLKQGPILGDLATAALLFLLVRAGGGDERRARWACALWLVLPYTVIVSAVWGQLDSVTTVVVLLAFGVRARSPAVRNLLLGFGLFAKWITGIFLPLELFRARGWARLGPFLALGAAAGATVGTFAAFGWSYPGVVAATTSQTHGGGLGVNLAFVLGFDAIGGWLRSIPYVLTVEGWAWVPAVVGAGFLAARWLRSAATAGLEVRAALFVLTFFFLTRWGVYEQYFLYLFAPLLLDVALFHPGRWRFFAYLVGVVSIDLLINNNLGVWWVGPLFPGTVTLATTVDESGTLDWIRQDALFAMAIVVTLSLVQLAWILWNDRADPRPWLYRVLPRPRSPPGGPP